jgi:hypothetical protein
MHFIIPNFSASHLYRAETKFKMLDNGAWEHGKALDTKTILKWAKLTKADEIVLPDVLFNREQTIDRTNEFIDSLTSKQLKQYKWAYVPQGKDPLEWIASYTSAHTWYPFNTICIPKWLQSKFHARSSIIGYLLRHNLWKHEFAHHLLGIDILSELLCIPKDVIRSIDSAKPITYGYYMQRLKADLQHFNRPPLTARPNKKLDEYMAYNASYFRSYANRQVSS